MKLAVTIITYLVGFIFFASGIAYLFHLAPMPAMTGDPATFGTLLATSGYMTFIKILETAIGLMLLIGFHRPLALLLLAPIVVNIALFEIFLAHKPGIGLLLVLLTGFLIYAHRSRYMPIVAKDF